MPYLRQHFFQVGKQSFMYFIIKHYNTRTQLKKHILDQNV